ncbi:sulfotransferase [Flagellimonas sp.]|uniref:sulfotransferase n=1 Tax=Flagellimonas sp. TaxID=2058762 RepID=UPI003BAB8FE2
MKKKLIYILGAGRSGTTILDIVLGNSTDAISLGEINRFFKRDGIAPKRKSQNKVYTFWSTIKKSIDKDLAQEYKNLKRLCDKNEYHTGFPRIYFGEAERSYQELLSKQYKCIAEHTKDKMVLVESSKYPTRALNVSNILGDKMDVSYVYLKKDPVTVVSSFGKRGLEQPAKSYLVSNAYYLIVNILCYLSVWKLRKRGHKVIVLKYEDLIAKPIDVLDCIGNELGIGVQKIQEKIGQEASLDTGFLFDGNRIRLKESIVLQKKVKEIDKKGLSYYFIRGFNYLVYR